MERPSFFDALSKDGPSVIAEFKRRSPSKGLINDQAGIEEVVAGYKDAGVKACSVLTDVHFGGEPEDLARAFRIAQLPLLRKDFIVDEYQIIEARALGASAILLIASVLSVKEISQFTNLARSLGLDVLFEVHNQEEVQKADPSIRIFGVNNRDLNTFKTDTQRSFELVKSLPAESLKVSESGLDNPETIVELYHAGYQAFLIGENFMKTPEPGLAARNFCQSIEKRLQPTTMHVAGKEIIKDE